MTIFKSGGVQVHLVNGHKWIFYQENQSQIDKICSDLEGSFFSKPSLIIDNVDHITAFPCHSLLGISVLTENLPENFIRMENLSNRTAQQIGEEEFIRMRYQATSKIEGHQSRTLSQLEFVSGESLFIEINDAVENGMEERSSLYHLFSRPTLATRRQDFGFSLWNTAQIVSWSLYPSTEVPSTAWQVDPDSKHITTNGVLMSSL